MPETEVAMDITLPAENGGRVSYKLVGDPVEPRIIHHRNGSGGRQ